jgi:DnaJ-class molecular chaperone
MTVPPGTQPGDVLRLRGKGMVIPGRDERGDLLVELAVRIPTDLGAEERELYERLRALHEDDAS